MRFSYDNTGIAGNVYPITDLYLVTYKFSTLEN